MTGRQPTRFLILSNELPNFGDASGAIAHRFIVLTMQRSWLGQENTASPMSAFVRECCETGAGKDVRGDVLYKAWKKWCDASEGTDR